jgi:hypothetical protein
MTKSVRTRPSLCAAALLAAAASFAPAQQQVEHEPVPLLPPLILNEICFDAGGVDGSVAAVGEWVEVLVLADNTNLGNYGFENQSGRRLGRFPNVTANKGTVAVMCLGTLIPANLDGDPSDKSAAFASGAVAGDHLNNTSGGVRLKNMISGNVIDAFYWGTGSAPNGTAVGPWGAGQFFDLAFAGGKPVNEGESVGRSAHTTNYPGSPADWAPHGGAVAAGPSPGRRNDLLHVYPSDLLSWAQSGINEAVLQYGEMRLTPGRFSITDATVASVAITFPTDYQMQVTAVHALTIEDSGWPETYTGTMTGSVTIDPNVATLGYTLQLEGMLVTSSGNAIGIEHSSAFGGFTTGPRSMSYATEIDWLLYGSAEWFDIQGQMTCARTADNAWLWSDTRNATDWVSPGTKTCVATNTITRLADGRFHGLYDLVRPFPSGPTSNPNAVEHFVMETDSTTKPDGTLAAQVLRFEQEMDGQPYLALQAGLTGQYVIAGTSSPTARTYTVDLDLPLEFANGPAFTMESYASGTLTTAGGKYVMTGTRGHRFNGNQAGEATYFIDPPIFTMPAAPQGQGQGGTTINNYGGQVTIVNGNGNTVTVNQNPQPAPPAQPTAPTTGGSTHSLGGLGSTTALCIGAGASSGAGLGTVTLPVVGTVAGSVAGGVGGGVVCGGAYLCSWAWEWLTN